VNDEFHRIVSWNQAQEIVNRIQDWLTINAPLAEEHKFTVNDLAKVREAVYYALGYNVED
jgi:hypothetical protein